MTILGLLFAFFLPAQGQALTSFDILGMVRDVKGQTVSSVRISVLDENYQPVFTAFVDSSGRFTVRGVRTGKYMFRIETTGTSYEEQQVGWIELVSIRKTSGAVEIYPIDFVLKFKKGEAPPGATAPVFAQEVPKPALKELEKAAKDLKNNKSEQALAGLKKAIELFPDYYEALELLGIEYVKTGQYEAAIPLLTHALEINKKSARCMYGLGVAHLRLNRLQEAVEWLEKSAQLESNNANTHMMLGLAYGTGGAFDKAETSFRRALQLGGAAANEAHFYLAGLYNKLERYSDAVQELEALLKEAKNLKDPAQVKAMIENLKQKESLKTAVVSLPKAAPKATPTTQTIEPAAPQNSTGATTIPPEPEPPTFTPVPPLAAQYVEVLQQSEKLGGVMHRRLLDYTYLLKKTKRTLNEHGKAVRTDEQVYEAYPIKGEHVLIKHSSNRIATKFVGDERKRAIKELEEAERRRSTDSASPPNGQDEVTNATGDYLSAGVIGLHQGKAAYISIDVSAFLRACEFFAPRVEAVGDRPTIALNFRPRENANLKPKYLYINRLVGTIWIDQEDKVVTRLEGWPISKAAFDLIQSTAPRSEASLIYQQERQPNGLWFPQVIRLSPVPYDKVIDKVHSSSTAFS